MSIHIEAKKGEIAETILLPGDPLRAKYIADTFLEDVVQYNAVRNMFGYTGTYKGKRISVQGTGMGIPSISIYANELMMEYGVKNLIRVGTMGALSTDIHVRDVVIAQAASTDAQINRNTFSHGVDYTPIADFDLLHTAYQKATEAGLSVRVGNVFSADRFYNQQLDKQQLADYGVLGIEMEAAALYTLAAQYKCRALAILTVSDHIFLDEDTTAEERQTTFVDMMKIALDTAIEF
ncbi:Purine nucleoside phosphorylase [Brachybacterium faecium]|nr:Purine nucleoside phosphorylase [Brachybacterium faecium]